LKRADQSVLVIAGYAPSLANFRGPLLNAMCAAGHRVIAAAPELSDHPSVTARLEEMGVETRNVPLSRAGLNPVADIAFLTRLIRLIRAERPTVILGYTVKPVIFGLIAAAVARVPRRYALVTGLGYGFADNPGAKALLVHWVQKLLYRVALSRATKIFFQNHDDPDLFRKLRLMPPGLPVVIVNGSGVDLEHFARMPLPGGPTRFLLIARLIGAKGVREYARAAELVRTRHPDAQFHLVGGLDTNPDALQRDEIMKWRDAGTIVWHGEVSDVRPHLAECHVYVLPSYYREGCPRSVLEAMAAGRAIITTDAPGCRETVIEGGNGFLVPPRSVEPLADAMERFVANPGLVRTMGRRSRELAEDKYDVDKVNARMLREMDLA
jgi:glycosyltransferase involved in cell wall biosynthesis